MAVIRLHRPFPAGALLAALPDTVRSIAVLDRTKEPGAPDEPLYLDVVAALAEAGRSDVGVIGGRYGLSSKEDTPAMVKAVLDHAAADRPRRHFTVGIVDDVSHSSLPVEPEFVTDRAAVRAVFYGMGSDGTVGPTSPRPRSSATGRTATSRPTSSTTPRSQGRPRPVTCASTTNPFTRPT